MLVYHPHTLQYYTPRHEKGEKGLEAQNKNLHTRLLNLSNCLFWLSSSLKSSDMRTIMARSPHESSFSFSKRHFQWIVARVSGEGASSGGDSEEEEVLTFSVTNTNTDEEAPPVAAGTKKKKKKKKQPSSAATAAIAAVSKFLSKKRTSGVTGTLFGPRRGHVRFAFQLDAKPASTVLIELAMPTSTLVKEMASGLVRIALECERRGSKPGKLLEETLWRGYCNGRKCGYGVRRECGVEDWRVLKAVEPVSMGAGVLPSMKADDDGDGDGEGEMMYMRAQFERVIGSRDSEALYMMNPDGNSGPELSIYLLRV